MKGNYMLRKRLAGVAAISALAIAAACSNSSTNTTPIVNAAASNAPTLGSTYQTNQVNGMTSYVNTAGTGSLSITASASAPSGATPFAKTAAIKRAAVSNGTAILYYTLTATTQSTITTIGFVNITMPGAPSGSAYMATLNGSQWLTVGGVSGKAGTYASGTLSVPGAALNGKAGVTLNAGQSLYVVVYTGTVIATPSPPPAPVASPSSISVPPGQTKSIAVTTGANVKVGAVSSDPTIATVTSSVTADTNGNADFTVTGMKDGSTTITFTDQFGLTGTASVNVSDAPVPNIQSAVLSPGAIETLTITTQAASVSAVTSDATILTVSPQASATPNAGHVVTFNVAAAGPGKATITFTDSNNNTGTFNGIVSNVKNGAFTVNQQPSLANWYSCSYAHGALAAPINEATPVPVAAPAAQTTSVPAVVSVSGNLSSVVAPPGNDNPSPPPGVGPTAPPVLGSNVALLGSLNDATVNVPKGEFGICQDITVSSNTPDLWFLAWMGGQNYNFKTSDQNVAVLDTTTKALKSTLMAEQHCYLHPQAQAPGVGATNGCWPATYGGDQNTPPYMDWIGGGYWQQFGPLNLSSFAGQSITLYFGNYSYYANTANTYANFWYLGNVQMLPSSSLPTSTPLAGRRAVTMQLHP